MNIILLSLIRISQVSSFEQSLFYIPPSTYGGISSVYLPETKSFYFHSGVANENSYIIGIQKFFFDPSNKSWRYQSEEDLTYPASRSFYGSYLYNYKYYIFAGIGSQGIFKDMWYYDIINDYWIEVNLQNPISRRYSFAYTSFTYNNKFYFAVVGGKSNRDADILQDFYL